MKTSEEIIKAQIEQEWEVPSDTEEGVIYKVRLFKNGRWECNCPAGQMGKECRHIKRKKFFYEKSQIRFDGYNLSLKFLRSDKSVRVEIDTSLDQWDKIAIIPKLPEGIYEITIKPK